MADLVDLLAPRPALRLLHGQVDVVVAGYHDIAYNGGIIQSVGKLDADTYVAGDWVVFLIDDHVGALILGKQTPGTPPAVPDPGGAPILVDADDYATLDSASGLWTAATVAQAPTLYGCWFYDPADLAPMAGLALASFEVQVVRSAGGPPEFFDHRNLTAVGALDLVGDTYASEQPPLGEATWISLPLDWGHQLVTGAVRGIGVGGGMNTGTYTGGSPNGQLRLTPL